MSREHDLAQTVRIAVDLGLQAWRATLSQRRFIAATDALAELVLMAADAERYREALEQISEHHVVSERGDENCDWHCTAEIVYAAKCALEASA